MRSNLCVAVLAVACPLGTDAAVRTAFGETPPPNPMLEEVRTVIGAPRTERERVRTGRVKLSGKKVVKSFGDPKYSWEGPIEGLYTFNRSANLFRYDGVMSAKVKVNLPGDVSLPTPEDSAAIPVRPNRYGHCRSREYVCSWGQIDPRAVKSVALLPLDREEEDRESGDAATFHVMAFGMLDDFGFQRSVELPEGHEKLRLWDTGRLQKGAGRSGSS